MLEQKEYWRKRTFYGKPEKLATRSFAESKLEYILKFLQVNKSDRILDVGAGNGIFTYHWMKYSNHVIGIDISDSMVGKSPCKKNMLIGDAFCLPFKDNSFDIVFTSCLLHHVSNPTGVINELYRTSKKYVVICEPNRNNLLMMLFSIILPWERGGIKFSKKFLKNIMEYGGLKLISVDTMGSITPNLTPSWATYLLKFIDKENCFGFYNLAVAEKGNPDVY